MNELSSKFVILILTISFQCEGDNFIRQDSTFSFANFVKNPFSKLASPILASLSCRLSMNVLSNVLQTQSASS